MMLLVFLIPGLVGTMLAPVLPPAIALNAVAISILPAVLLVGTGSSFYLISGPR
jgi:hypothetical protein